MAVKRKSEHEEVETMKRLREEQETIATTADRLTNLPEPLLLHVLSSLETKVAIQTLTLWKSPVSSWTCIPVLNFNSHSFQKLHAFEKFVNKALSLRGSAKLEKLTFKCHKTCRTKIIRKVFCYAFSNDVKELKVYINHDGEDRKWPMSSDSLTSFILGSSFCSLYGPRPGSFKNLTSLRFKLVIIEDLDPFSGYPALEKLTLVDCSIRTKGNVLNVHALHLSELTIVSIRGLILLCELTTPKLRCFEYRGSSFPRLSGDLPILDTVVVEYDGICNRADEKKLFDDVVMLFDKLCHTKSLTVFSTVFHILSFFPDELVKRNSPFRDLKCLKLDFSLFHHRYLFRTRIRCCNWDESMKHLPGVKAYLLHNSHDAQCIMIYPSWRAISRRCVDNF